jgi:hypothetical protein
MPFLARASAAEAPSPANLTSATWFGFEPLLACLVNVGGVTVQFPVIAPSGLNGGHMIGKLSLLVGAVGLCSSLGALVHAQAMDSARLGSAVSRRAAATNEPADFQSLVSPIKYRHGRVVAHRRAPAVSRDGYCDYDVYPSCFYDGYAFTGNGLAIVGGLPVVRQEGSNSRLSRP